MKKNTLYSIFVFIGVFVVVVGGYYIYTLLTNPSEEKYSCIDYETNTTYSFATEEEMHEVCDKFNGKEYDEKLENYPEHEEITEAEDESFSFYPYVNSDNKLAIIVVLLDCNDIDGAKQKALNWLTNKGYNLNNYVIEYEYPCE